MLENDNFSCAAFSMAYHRLYMKNKSNFLKLQDILLYNSRAVCLQCALVDQLSNVWSHIHRHLNNIFSTNFRYFVLFRKINVQPFENKTLFPIKSMANDLKKLYDLPQGVTKVISIPHVPVFWPSWRYSADILNFLLIFTPLINHRNCCLKGKNFLY